MLLLTSNYHQWILVVIVYCIVGFIQGQSDIVYPAGKCSANNQYLRITSLSCVACSSLDPNYEFIITNNAITTESFPCRCKYGFRSSWDSSTGKLTCVPCPAGTNSSIDRTFCVSCGDSSTLGANGFCSCSNPSHVLVDREITGAPLNATRCISCDSRSYPSSDKLRCISCPDPRMQANLLSNNITFSCDCPDDSVVRDQGNKCILKNGLSALTQAYPSPQSISYYNVISSNAPSLSSTVSVNSDFFEDYFTIFATECQAKSDDVSCQGLANLCVLNDYDLSMPACKLYSVLARAKPGTIGSPDWPIDLPWLYFGINSGETPTATLKRTLKMDVTFNDEKTNRLNIVLAKYSWNGTFLGYEPFYSQAQICALDAVPNDEWLKMGYAQSITCTLDIKDLIDPLISDRQTFFYDPYVIDGTGKLQPVIVRNINFRSNNPSSINANNGNRLVNSNARSDDDQLTRRFFIYDVISSRSRSTNKPNIIRYLSSLKIIIEKDEGIAGTIRIPVIEVGYTDRAFTSLQNDEASKFSLKVSFVMEVPAYIQGISIIASLIGLIAVILWLYMSFVELQRSEPSVEKRVITNTFIFQSMFIFCGNVAFGLFAFLFISSIYWLLIFKGQSVVFAFLPDSGNYFTQVFQQLVVTATILLACNLAQKLWQQAQVDVFFVDWEKSRGRTVDQYGNERMAPISVWRTLFAANEWNELQNYRKVSLVWTVFILAFLLTGLGLRDLALANAATGSKATPSPTSLLLLFPLNTCLWIAVILANRIFQFAVKERFFGHPILQFVDLLSISNLSMIILDESYHGYYIHGRSVHPHADTDMFDMTTQLQKETTGLIARRGLHDTDQQIFEVFLAKPIKLLYERIYRILVMEDSNKGKRGANTATNINSNANANTNGPSVNAASPSFGDSSILKAYQTMNKFWCYFIDRDLKDHVWTMREKTFVEATFNIVPDVTDHSVFFVDAGSTIFSQCTLAGLETRLLVFYMLLFTVVDYGSGDTFIAAGIIFILDQLLMIGRGKFGRDNLSHKSLVDSRFLI